MDDQSTDSSVSIVEKYAKIDDRIHLIQNERNSGAAISRNEALKHSNGRFVAYIDSDDLWDPNKLTVQLKYMQEHQSAFSCASYRVIDEDGHSLGKDVYMRPQVDYKGFLTNNLLQTIGIVVDLSVVDRKLCIMPNLRRRQDAATWLQILKNGYVCEGIDEPLGSYRRTAGSLSSSKVKAVKGVWFLYRQVEHLSLPFSIYCFVRYAFLAVWKRTYVHQHQE